MQCLRRWTGFKIEIQDSMKKPTSILVLSLVCCSHVYARDGFENVHCGADIAKALAGQHASNERVVVIEGRHKDLNLKDLGASDYGTFSSISWMICGEEYMVLEENRGNIVRDAILIPSHSKETPQFEGSCKQNGKPLPGSVVGLLRDENGKDELQAIAAWHVNEKSIKFVKLPVDGLLCSRDGIIPEPK
jgi:hypothetical protein